MTSSTMIYTLETINSIIFDGFDYKLPEKTLEIISSLALQVGSPDYVKTPVFQKRDNPMKCELPQKETFKKNKRSNKATEIVNDEDWETLRTFQSTKIEEKSGIDAQIDATRVFLNKLTDKNYNDMRNNIFMIIDKLVCENTTQEDLARFNSSIFDIASNNRFYSKMYAELYSELLIKYPDMRVPFNVSLSNFTKLFDTIEYVDPNTNYDKFCEVNKMNEKRKSLASFYLNLMNNGIVSKDTIIDITRNLVSQLYNYISEENKKNEVDELSEIIALLYKKDLYEADNSYEKIEGLTIIEVIVKIANSKVKDYKSLTNKSLFKFMDLIDM